MALEPIGDISDVSLTATTVTSDLSRAQMLARVGHPQGRIANDAGVSISEAQYLVRRIGKGR